MCSAKTLDKQMRKIGVLNGEVETIDLSKKPVLNLGVNGITPESIRLDKEMSRSVKNLLYFILNNDLSETFDSIDANGDRHLSVSEIGQWFCRTRLKTNDQLLMRKWRNIINLCMKIVDQNNDGSVSKSEFPLL